MPSKPRSARSSASTSPVDVILNSITSGRPRRYEDSASAFLRSMLLIVMRFGQRTVESIICSGDTDRFDPSSRLQVSRKVWRFVRAEWLAAGRVAFIGDDEAAACAHSRAHRA